MRLLEVCVDNWQGALAADKGGADRLELCASLADGGITPSSAFIVAVKKAVKAPVYVMVRPRSGDFTYSEAEFAIMLQQIEEVKQAGADGIVTGVINQQGELCLQKNAALIAAARPLGVTLHRAFDVTPNLSDALEAAIGLGFERILTSGGKANAFEGLHSIAQLVQQAAGRISIMPGSGINTANIRLIVQITRAHEYHFSAKINQPSPLLHLYQTHPAALAQNIGYLTTADEDTVRRMKQALLTI
ncbi:MAG: copper homeostasis protein CutC [Cytophagales bacterium]|nr:copper homeostasis protein CutC [Bernardetiaceae bacterium]MDW8203732.1 copper homeostasis protein CutC [Cytophagales bacterium]